MASEWSVLPWRLPCKCSKPSGYFLWSSGAFFDVSSNFPVTLSNQLHPNAFNCHALASLQIAIVCKLIRLDGSFFWTYEIRSHPRATKKHWKLSLTKGDVSVTLMLTTPLNEVQRSKLRMKIDGQWHVRSSGIYQWAAADCRTSGHHSKARESQNGAQCRKTTRML